LFGLDCACASPRAATPPHPPPNRATPGLLSAAGYALIASAAALVYLVDDTSAGELFAQALGALALGGAGVAALVGSGLIADLQKIE
jgi:hypothetical protein